MMGKLFIIGVGPGDPELLTLKAVRILNEVPVIFVPKGREEGTSLALSIAQKAVRLAGKEIIELHFPMKKTVRSSETSASSVESLGVRGERREGKDELNSKWNEAVDTVLSRLNTGVDAAFITLGDPMIYSTFFYLYDRLLEKKPDLAIEIIPGVSSITAAAATSKISLGLADEKIAILPATYVQDLETIFQQFDTVVLMKVHRVFDRVKAILQDAGLARNAVYVARAGMAGEEMILPLPQVKDEKLDYFSLVIVKK